MFGIFSIIFFDKNSRKLSNRILTIIFYVLAVRTKEMYITLPLFFGFVDAFRGMLTGSKLDIARIKKNMKNGGFEDKIFLEHVN